MSHSLINQTLSVARTSALIINTFDDLEAPFLTHLSSIFDKIYTIGPLHALSKSRLGDSSSSPSALAGFWKEDRTCMSWLDSQPPRSVILVSFGSLVKIKENELMEIWHGLVNSGKPFLCVLRPDVVYGGESESGQLIKQLVGERGNNGNWMVVEWAAQERVLVHPAVGAFLTHCGWNSVTESIVAGVPMICWPSIGDQPINSTWIDKVWKIGIEKDQKWDRSTVEMMIRELMDGQKGVEIQISMTKLSKLATEKIAKGGLSSNNLELLIQHLKIL